MPGNEPSNIMWSQFTQEIGAKLGAGATEASIQVLPTAHLLSGNDGDEIAQSIDAFAAYLPQWGSVYTRSEITLIDAYQSVLTQIKETATSGKSVEAEYDAEHEKLKNMMGQASSFKLEKIKIWYRQVLNRELLHLDYPWPAFTDWYRTHGLKQYASLVKQQKMQAEKVHDLLLKQGIVSPVIGALQRLNDELDKIKDRVVPPVTINPDADMLAGWKKVPTKPGSITFSNKSGHYDYSNTVWHSQSGAKPLGFFSIGHRNATDTKEITISTSPTYKLEMDFAAQAVVDIGQEDWFDSAILREHKEGPWIEGSQFDKALAHPYGQGGVLPLVPTSIYVVMNPTITITLDQSTYKSFKEQLDSSGGSGLSLGPFTFLGRDDSSSGTRATIDTDDQQQRITCTDKSNIPQIIAVVNQVMP